MRKSTLLWLVLATASGVVLFHTSQKVHDGREKLQALEKNLAREEESVRVLQAEWGYLNEPARLEKLARNYLHLVPLKGSQFAKVEDFPLRPPPEEALEVAAEKTPVAEETAAPVIITAPPVNIVAEKEERGSPKLALPARVVKTPKPAATASLSPQQVSDPHVFAPAMPAPRAPAAPARDFNSLMKSLGAR